MLQQLDTPARIYSDPANLFVAGFIGSPPMNFLRGTLANHRFETEGLALAADLNDGPATLGVRPEECALVAAADGVGRGRIYSVELIGDHSLVTLNVGEQKVVVKVSNHVRWGDRHGSRAAVESGARVFLRSGVGRAHRAALKDPCFISTLLEITK